MLPLILESENDDLIQNYLVEHYLLHNLVGEVRPENDSIGLPAIKYLIDRAKFTHPEKSQAVFIIYNGHMITPIAQNALLKTLEESKPYEQFVITTPNHHLLLETIISRCQVVGLSKTAPVSADQSVLKTFVESLKTTSKAVSSSDEILSDTPKLYLREVVDNLKQANRHFPTTKRVKIINLALECLSDLDRNINPKLAMDHFLLESHRIIEKST